MKMRVTLIAMILVMAGITALIGHGDSVPSPVTRHSGDEIDILFGSNQVTIDGINSTGEWNDASTMLISQSSGNTWTIHYKHNLTHLMFAFHHPGTFIAEICIDTLHDAGSFPQSDDYKFHSSMVSQYYNGSGTYTWNGPYQDKDDWDASDYMDGDFREFTISFSKIGINSGQMKTLGVILYVAATPTPDNGIWPSGGSTSDPSTWANMTSSDYWAQGSPVNDPPVLSDASVSPGSGFTSDPFTYSVTYTDNENDAPTVNRVYIDDVEYDMTSSDATYDDGSLFEYTTDLTTGDHNYYFLFNDGENEVRMPETGTFSGPTVITPNAAPTMNGTEIADHFIDEDSGEGAHIIDLEEYFYDDRDDGALVFGIQYQENESLLRAVIDGNYLSVQQMVPNWFGALEFQVNATDLGYDGMLGENSLTTESNVFTITVNSTNDLPKLVEIGSQPVIGESMEFLGVEGAIQDEWFSLTIAAEDLDLEGPGEEDLTFSINSTRWMLQPIMGSDTVVNLTLNPGNDDVGMHYILFSVTDLEGSNASLNLTIEVSNVNDPPVIELYLFEGGTYGILNNTIEFTGEKAGSEGDWLNLSLQIHDPDMDIGITESVIFSSNVTMDDLHVDAETGNISFLPTQEDVGTHYIQITVMDLLGAEVDDFVNITIEVLNVNDAPEMVQITHGYEELEFKEGDWVNLSGSGTDIDLMYDDQEVLSFKWTSDLDGALGTDVNLSVSDLSVGSHNITLMVTDHYGLFASATLMLVVDEKVVIDPGDNETPEDNNRDEEDDDKSLPIIVAIIIVIVIIALALVLFLVFRKKGSEDAPKESQIDEPRQEGEQVSEGDVEQPEHPEQTELQPENPQPPVEQQITEPQQGYPQPQVDQPVQEPRPGGLQPSVDQAVREPTLEHPPEQMVEPQQETPVEQPAEDGSIHQQDLVEKPMQEPMPEDMPGPEESPQIPMQ